MSTTRNDPILIPEPRWSGREQDLWPGAGMDGAFDMPGAAPDYGSLRGGWGQAGRCDVLKTIPLALHAQPIQALGASDAPDSRWYEVLLRLPGPCGRTRTPERFIAAAERCGAMPAIDRWVVRTSLCWLGDVGRDRGTRLSVNLSATSVERPGTVDFILRQLERSAVAPARACFELTETASIGDLGQARRTIAALRAEGCGFALDDFGSGAASFSYLKQFDADFLKIDAGFVRDLGHCELSRRIVSGLSELAVSLGMATIAEGVEERSMVADLVEAGVDFAQGFALGPVAALRELELGEPA